MPAIVIGIPIQAYSKKPNCSSGIPAAFKATFARIFGGVPIRVIVPPSPAANAKGINSREAEILALAQIPITTGIRQAVVPVLESTADISAAMIIMPNIRLFSPLPNIRTTPPPIFWASPV